MRLLPALRSGAAVSRPAGARVKAGTRASRFVPLAILVLFIVVAVLALAGGQDRIASASGLPRLPETSAPSPTLDYDLRFASFDAGRTANAARPFTHGPLWAAEPFIFSGGVEDRERATTCLASAVWYEAGDNQPGEEAVAQVVVNRMLHPAFPKTVCGVVFQRSSPTGGCQFTFTCDGSFRRIPSLAAWQRARMVAERALSGFVYAPVGTATFYHADRVLPYWSSAFDKIARVGAHLFYRLRGSLGRPAAFTSLYQGGERIDPRLIALNRAIHGVGGPVQDSPSPAVAAPGPAVAMAAVQPAPAAPSVPGVDLRGSILRLIDEASGQFGLQLNPAVFPGSYAIVALGLCHDKPSCTVMGWLQPKLIPASLPSAASAMQSLSFLYRKDESRGVEQVLWNCRQVVRSDLKQCMPGTATAPAA